MSRKLKFVRQQYVSVNQLYVHVRLRWTTFMNNPLYVGYVILRLCH